ncbi:hypothetical protein ACFX1T_010192 [Malus domestica]
MKNYINDGALKMHDASRTPEVSRENFLQTLPVNKQNLRLLCSTLCLCVTKNPTVQSFNVPLVSELLGKQHWLELKTHLKGASFAAALHQLFGSGADQS